MTTRSFSKHSGGLLVLMTNFQERNISLRNIFLSRKGETADKFGRDCLQHFYLAGSNFVAEIASYTTKVNMLRSYKN